MDLDLLPQGEFCSQGVREGLIVGFIRSMCQTAQSFCDSPGEKGGASPPALLLLLSRLCLDYETATISYILTLTDEQFLVQVKCLRRERELMLGTQEAGCLLVARTRLAVYTPPSLHLSQDLLTSKLAVASDLSLVPTTIVLCFPGLGPVSSHTCEHTVCGGQRDGPATADPLCEGAGPSHIPDATQECGDAGLAQYPGAPECACRHEARGRGHHSYRCTGAALGRLVEP